MTDVLARMRSPTAIASLAEIVVEDLLSRAPSELVDPQFIAELVIACLWHARVNHRLHVLVVAVCCALCRFINVASNFPALASQHFLFLLKAHCPRLIPR